MTFRRRCSSLPLDKIRITDRFWTRWQSTLIATTLAAEFQQLEVTGRLENFRRVARGEKGGFQGLYFNDSDVYKWLEAACLALQACGPDPGVRRMVDETVRAIAGAQEPDGYLNTYFQLEHPDLKWRNLSMLHEMYCAGHLFESAVEHHRATGEDTLLQVAVRKADLIESLFAEGKRLGYCGHEEIELALLKLSDETGDARYRQLSKWMVERRGYRPSPFEQELADEGATQLSAHGKSLLCKDDCYNGEYAQDHAPIREHTEVVGHAVRAMYLYMAATELADGDPELSAAMVRVWENLTRKRMYVTGGIGPAAKNEGFTVDYDLPNLSAYAETCAAVGLAMWGQRLLEMTGNGEYADVVERALYNGALSGISISGDRFFYANPLESRGEHHRVPWFNCACCPPNIARLLAGVGRYVAGASDDGFWIHIPAGFQAETEINGVPVRIVVESDYPWSGKFIVRVDPERPVQMALRVRIPEHCDDCSMELRDSDDAGDFEEGYAVFERTWTGGDVLEVELEMHATWVEADPRVLDNLGRSALTYGPLVYCAEEHDHGFPPQLLTVEPLAEEEPEAKLASLEGFEIIQLSVPATREASEWTDQLYSPVPSVSHQETQAQLIPYFAWCNRGPNAMQVWLRKRS